MCFFFAKINVYAFLAKNYATDKKSPLKRALKTL